MAGHDQIIKFRASNSLVAQAIKAARSEQRTLASLMRFLLVKYLTEKAAAK
jgi:hypothetical protein